MKRLLVYTSVFGGRDPIRLPPADADFDFVAFTDQPAEDLRVVQVQPPVPSDPRRSSRAIKILLPETHRYSLWIDGSVALKTGRLDHLVDRYLSGDTPLAAFRHPSRTCAYQEASVCLSAKLDDPAVIRAQAASYRAAGMPENTGLAELTVVLRDHERSTKFSLAWWEEVRTRSCRDQISFPFVAWQTGFRWTKFEGLLRENSHFELMPHN